MKKIMEKARDGSGLGYLCKADNTPFITDGYILLIGQYLNFWNSQPKIFTEITLIDAVKDLIKKHRKEKKHKGIMKPVPIKSKNLISVCFDTEGNSKINMPGWRDLFFNFKKPFVEINLKYVNALCKIGKPEFSWDSPDEPIYGKVKNIEFILMPVK